MSDFIVQGWCPGALRPMMSGDGLVVRVRPRNNSLTAAQATGLAEAAILHGNGFLALSNRANINIRGVRPDAYPALISDLQALGLVDPDPDIESRRNILVNPIRPYFFEEADLHPNTAIADELAEALAAPGAPRLPGKFGFVVDLGRGLRHLANDIGDIRIESAEWPPSGPNDFILRADGMATGRLVTRATAVPLAIEMAHWFVASGGIGPDGRGRMRHHIARGARPPAELTGEVVPAGPAVPSKPGHAPGGWLLAFALGQIRAEKLGWLVKAGGCLHITPWRMIYFSSGHKRPRKLSPDLDFIANPVDPLLRVFACIGAPGCPQAHAPTRDLARRLARSVPAGQVLHVSGCAKGCAHPSRADLTLVATPVGFDLIRDGSATDTPLVRGLDPATLTIGP